MLRIATLFASLLLTLSASAQTTGGFPSRPKFQSVGVGVAAPAGVGNVTITGTFTGAHSGSGASLTNLNASNLASGTVPDARFPATLPALSGVNLTALNATNLGSGTVPNARFPATLPAISGVNLTSVNADLLDGINSTGFCQTGGTGCPSAGSIAAAGSDTQVQFNDGGNFGGDADFIWNKTTNTLTLGSLAVQMNLRAPNALTSTAAGAPINITSGAGGATSGVGGDLNLTSGSSTANSGGALRVTSGASSTGTAGTVTVAGGSASGGGDGGNVVINGGAASSGNGLGGDIQIIGGNSSGAAEGGDISITTGTSSGAGGTGDLTINAGTGTVDITASDLTFNGSSLPVCSTGTFTGTLTGMTGSVTGTVTYRMCGTKVTIYQAGSSMSGTSNSVAMTMTGVPAAIQPIGSNQQNYPMRTLSDNGVSGISGTAAVQGGSGTITFSLCTVSGANVVCNSSFTNSGTKGLNLGWSVSYERNTG